MTENRFSCNSAGNSLRETICIEANRILDSCRDRDCFEDIRVHLTDFGKEIIERSTNVRTKNACISWTYIGVDPVKFNRGFYSVTIRFYVKITFEACIAPGRSQEFDGIAVVEKKVILFGGESCVSIFKSSPDTDDYCSLPEPCCTSSQNLPVAVVEVVEPIVLNTRIVENSCECQCCCCACEIPESVKAHINGAFDDNDDSNARFLAVSFGIFSIVRIIRPGQYLINASEYFVPDKECIAPEKNNPCHVFKNMAFPTNEFSHQCGIPLPPNNSDRKCGCN